jgi:hypothetical protein
VKGKAPVRSAELAAGTTAVRVALPGAGCEVEDHMRSPRVKGGSVTFDPATGVLAVKADTVSVTIPEKMTPWLEREISVRALTSAPSP